MPPLNQHNTHAAQDRQGMSSSLRRLLTPFFKATHPDLLSHVSLPSGVRIRRFTCRRRGGS